MSFKYSNNQYYKAFFISEIKMAVGSSASRVLQPNTEKDKAATISAKVI